METTTTRSPTESLSTQLFVIWGTMVWAVVTLSTRLVGHLLLVPANELLLVGVFVAAVPLMALVTYPVYRWRNVSHEARPATAVLMSLPGLFLDVLVLAFYEMVFPNMPAGTARYFGALLLFGYAIVLLTGFVPGRSS